MSEQLSFDDVFEEPCSYSTQCDERRWKLSYYREGSPCHWVAFWDVEGCPIYQNGGRVDQLDL